MDVEPFHIPMLYGRIAIAAAALTHALFATFIVGSSLIGAACETVGYVTGKSRFERLSRHIAFTLIFTTAGVSFLGVTFVFALNIFWPRFWSTLFRIMFWPLLLEATFFLAEAVFAYAWYYSWDWAAATPARKRLHLAFGWTAAASSVIAMVMIDIVASYMLTPRAPDDTWGKIFNPTMVYLDTHRLVGNLTWTGFGLAALWAVGFLRAATAEERAFFRWAGGVCFGIGFCTLLIMPVIGYQYLLKVRYSEPQAFHTLMLGPRSWLFDLVALLYSALIVSGSYYITRALTPALPRDGTGRIVLPVSVVILTLAGLMFSMPYHLQHIPLVSRVTDVAVNPLGAMQPNKYVAIALLVLFGLLNWIYFLRSFSAAVPWWRIENPTPDRMKPKLLIALSMCAMLMMLTMGWARETARAWNGYLIYGVMTFADEAQLYQPERRGAPVSR